MKRTLTALVVVLLASLAVQAQDFKLFFANNVSDVVQFEDIESAASELVWREVKDKEIAGNVVEVDQVKQMFASEDVKYKAQQRQFWRMRDHCLLCFRIDDGTNGANSYQVEVEDTVGRPKTITVSRFFFLNVMRQENPISVRVWQTGRPDNTITFRYYVADWDDRNLYTFQLDSKRQVEKEEYGLQYRVGYVDEQGEGKVETHQLALRDSSFQSFYVADNQNLIDVMLMSGKHKLRLNKARLHTGVTLDPDFERTVLTTRFTLDKHENRELVNFNWVGSGLYEQFDTLYLGIVNEAGDPVTKATLNVDAVDENGVSTGIKEVRYLSYDRRKKVYMILTYGNPAYIEILANGYLPVVYRYQGAADAEGVVDLERCNDNVTLFADRKESGKIGVSSQHLYTLNDSKTVETWRGKDHCVCNLADYDLSVSVQADTITYMEDAGNSWPKLYNGAEVSRLAQLELAYSSVNDQDAYEVKLKAVNVDTDEQYESRWPRIKGIYAKNHPGFTRDYYFATFDLTDFIPQNTLCQLTLESNGNTYDKFPYLRNLHVERSAVKKAGEDFSKNDMLGSNDEEKVADTYAEQGCSFNFPMSFKLNLGPLFQVKNSMVFDLLKQKLTSTTTFTYMRQGSEDEDKFISEMRAEAKEYANGPESGHTWYEGGDGIKYSNVGDTRKFDEWFVAEMDDICSIDYNKIGTGFFGSGKFKFSLNFNRLLRTGRPIDALSLDEISGTFGYGTCLGSPNLLEEYWTDGAISHLLQKIPMLHVGGVFEASVQADLGFKTFNSSYPSSWDNFGFFLNLSAKVRGGLWAEISIPSNPIFAASAGLRGGAKIGIMGGLATPFQANRFCYGLYGVAGMGIEAYANIRTYGFQWAGRAGMRLAARFYAPDNGHNPFHKDFPYWLTDSKAKTVAESYRPLPALGQSTYGHTIVSDVASDANPHFLDENHIVYNDLGNPADYNDDRVMMMNLKDSTFVDLSDSPNTATHHMRSKRGDFEVVVYEQLARQIDPAEMDADHALSKTNELAARTQIMSRIKQPDGSWKKFAVTSDDGMVDTKPVVTTQEDGKAACIWQHGTITTIDDSVSPDSVYNTALVGELQLSVFDGYRWTPPVVLHQLNKDLVATEYDLIMRNDTVLVGTNLDRNPLDSLNHSRNFIYSSVDVASMKLSQRKEVLKPVHFFMNRIGQHSVIALLYEKSDSLRDVYVKTLSMDGFADGLMGSDIGANYASPNRVKIICDRAANKLNDFAILWTEVSNNSHEENGAESFSETPRNMLNASRINLEPSPFVTVPLTLGAESGDLMMMDFDGVLDDSHIKVVYSLADIETGGAVIMTNEKYFSNSFTYDIGYATRALLGSPTLPIAVSVSNTGTSSIRSVTATLNGMEFPIAESYVAPMQKRTFVVQYPIDENFDGYITNSVAVVYNNAFRAQHHPRRKAQSFLRQVKSRDADHVDMENVELRLVRHGVQDDTNYYVVELIDRSVYGLKPHNTIRVGLYPHPTLVVPISDDAETVVSASDFQDYGGIRKAYATVRISGVKSQTSAYLTTHLYDSNLSGDIATAHVKNHSGSENAHYVSLLPHNDPTVIRALQQDKTNVSAVSVRVVEGGVVVTGLEAANHLRLFNSSGMIYFSKKDAANGILIPLQHHDAYVLSTGREVVKFAY